MTSRARGTKRKLPESVSTTRVDDSQSSNTTTESNSEEQSTDELECTICYDKCADDRGVLDCSHYFCFNCIKSWSKQENTCPLCKSRFTAIEHVQKSKSARAKQPFKKKKVKVKSKDQGNTAIRRGGITIDPHNLVAMFLHQQALHYFLGEFNVMFGDDDNDSNYDEPGNNPNNPIDLLEIDEDEDEDGMSEPVIVDLTLDSDNEVQSGSIVPNNNNSTSSSSSSSSSSSQDTAATNEELTFEHEEEEDEVYNKRRKSKRTRKNPRERMQAQSSSSQENPNP